MRKWKFRVGVVLAFAPLIAIGCGKDAKDQANKDGASTPSSKKEGEKPPVKTAHSGWWCEEHGVPEKDCSLCLPDADVKTRFKDKNDWCKEHERAQSQCFKCDPSKYAKFEAQYEAKYGKKPPRPPEEEFKK